MAMTDPIADLLTRVRNALRIECKRVSIPYSRVKEEICRVLKEEGFIIDCRVTEDPKKTLHVFLKYGPHGERVINEIKRVSKPGRRIYRPATEIPRVLNGLGIAILSTSKGIMSGRQCHSQKVGGEVLCTVW